MGVPWCWAQDVVWQLTAPASIVQLEAARYSERAFYTYSTGSNTYATQVVNTVTGAPVGPLHEGRGVGISRDGTLVALLAREGTQNRTHVREVETGTLIGTSTFVTTYAQFGHISTVLYIAGRLETNAPDSILCLELPALSVTRNWVRDNRGTYFVNPDEPTVFQRSEYGQYFEFSVDSTYVRSILRESARSNIAALYGRLVALIHEPSFLSFQIAGNPPYAMRRPHNDAIRAWTGNGNGLLATVSATEVALWRMTDATELARFNLGATPDLSRYSLTANDLLLVGNGQSLTAHRLGSGLAANATLSGTLRQTGLAQPAGVPLTIELASSQPAGTEVHRVTADPEGRFRVRTSLTGTLRARFKTPTGLSTVFDALSIPADVGNLTLHTGDVDGNNSVALADFVAMRNAFGSKIGTPAYLEGADLNRDGTVNTMDFLLLRNHYGRSGQ